MRDKIMISKPHCNASCIVLANNDHMEMLVDSFYAIKFKVYGDDGDNDLLRK